MEVMRRTLLAICLGVFLLSAALMPALAREAPEYNVKAAYLLLFTRYVEWPQDTFDTPDAPIEVCVLGEDPFGNVLDRTLEGQQSQNRELRVRRIDDVGHAGSCHVAFVGAPDPREQARWLDALSDHPILTVAETPAAFDHGAVISFVAEQGRGQARIRFEVSYPAMQRAKLKISSPMLVAARKVHRANGV